MKMNYILMPSLEHIALVKTAITLWNQDDITTLVTDSCFLSLFMDENDISLLDIKDKMEMKWQNKKQEKVWLEIEKRVLKKVMQLSLPKCLKGKLSCIIKPIGLEQLNWFKYHYTRFHILPPNNLCWTSQGTIDKKKTAEVLVKDENLHIVKRYILACTYCLEDNIKELWEFVPQSMKLFFHNSGHLRYPTDYQLVAFWTYYIKGEVTQLTHHMAREMSPNQFAFEYAAFGNKVAIEFFLKKLNHVEREECFMRYLVNPVDTDSSDVLCFLLSQMNEEEQIKFFRAYSFNVLDCLLKWPFQNFFLETYAAIYKLDLLDETEYLHLLKNITLKISKGYKDCNYQELIRQIWLKSPSTHKKYVLDDWADGWSPLLHDMAYQGNIMLILKHLTVQEKEKIIFSNKRCCLNLMYDGKWNKVKSFIQVCLSSKDIMIKFKNELIAEFNKLNLLEIQKDSWRKLFQLLNELIHKEDKKRAIEEGESSQAKRPHIIKKINM